MSAVARVREAIADERARRADGVKGRPVVTLTFAQSLDGCLCREPGKALAISSSATMAMTHELRAAHAAIVVGVGTLLADNPSLTTRFAEGTDPQPIVLDSRLATPLDCKLFVDERCRLPPLIVCTEQGAADQPDRRARLEAAGARVLPVMADVHGHVDLLAALDALGPLFDSVMIEGGAKIITALLANPACCSRIQRVVLTVAPIFVGGYHAVQQPLPESLERFWRMESNEAIGGDVVVALVPKN